MESVIKAVGTTAGPAAQVIEVQDAVREVVKPEGGFPWCGVGIGLGVVVVAAACAKLYKCTAKK